MAEFTLNKSQCFTIYYLGHLNPCLAIEEEENYIYEGELDSTFTLDQTTRSVYLPSSVIENDDNSV
jgi:hypothetical protein